jgi:hypothetical protein
VAGLDFSSKCISEKDGNPTLQRHPGTPTVGLRQKSTFAQPINHCRRRKAATAIIMKAFVGLLAFGSIIDSPGAEIEATLVGRILNVPTPFGVEFGRTSIKRSGAPTLVPVQKGGSPVLAQILLVNISEEESKDRLWRRELNRVGQSGHYVQHENPGPNTLVIDHYESFEGVGIVIAARFAVTISPLTAVHLAELAIKSARLERTAVTESPISSTRSATG